ncbi:MAG: hypothetical protein IKP23_00305 [Elusimicrobiaceae bacterium]|nr:hypothetical protein [Elusimicrobiaceae bacterium]
MTAIIISILAALGIGGGVMLASGGSGGSSGGAAVVAPVNPGTGGGGSNTGGSNTGGSNTGGSNTGGSNTGGSNTGGSNTGGSNTGGTTGGNTGGTSGSSNVGALLASGSLSGVSVVGKAAHGNTTLSGKNLSIGMAPFAPILVSGTTYKTNEERAYTVDGNYRFVSGYTADNPIMKKTINLGTIKSSTNYADFYNLPAQQTKNIPTLHASFVTGAGGIMENTVSTNLTDLTWTFNLTNFALGARKLGLQYSEFGYYSWKSVFTNYMIEHGYSSGTWAITSSSLQKRYTRYGAQQFYMFNTSRQFTGSNYTSRYGNNATFSGNVIGVRHFLRTTCGVNNVANLTGDITLNLNLANKNLSGNISNVVVGGSAWYSFTLTGTIKDVTSSEPYNIIFTNVDYDRNQTASLPYTLHRYDGNNLTPMNNNGSNFGDAVIVKGSSVSKDEMVGQLAFTGHTAEPTGSTSFNNVFISFGAKKQ